MLFVPDIFALDARMALKKSLDILIFTVDARMALKKSLDILILTIKS